MNAAGILRYAQAVAQFNRAAEQERRLLTLPVVPIGSDAWHWRQAALALAEDNTDRARSAMVDRRRPAA